MLFNPKPKIIMVSTNGHRKNDKVQEAGPSGIKQSRVAVIKKKVVKEVEIQTEMNWEQTLKEMEYFMCICKTCELKPAKELFTLGGSECPDLNPEILERKG